MSKVNATFHIVINTYYRRMTIPEAHKRELYMYIYGIIKKMNCKLLRMNGIGNHIHIFAGLHPTVCIADFVKIIKQNSSRWMKDHPNFSTFEGWGKEYFAFSISKPLRDNVIEYIKNQEVHHQTHTFENELEDILTHEGYSWDDNLLT